MPDDAGTPERERPVATMASRPEGEPGSARRFTPDVPTGWSRLRQAFTQRPDAGQVVVAGLVFLLGFAGAVQLGGDEDDVLQNSRRDDLLQVLDGLTLQGERLEEQVGELDEDRSELVDAGGSEAAALAQAQERLRQLNILAGVSAATGPGIEVSILDPNEQISSGYLLSGIHELRSAGAEAIQIGGSNGETVRVVADSYFLDVDNDVVVDGVVLEPPYTLIAIGDSATLAGAVNFPRGLADDVSTTEIGGQAIVEEAEQITVDAVREAREPRYASPSPEDE